MIPSTVNKPLYVYSLWAILGLLLNTLPLQAQLTLEWNKTYGGTLYEEMNTAITTSDGSYVFGGITNSRTPAFEVTTNTIDTVDYPHPEPTGDFWMIKADGLGNKIWDRRYGGHLKENLWSIVETNDGGLLIGGESRSGVGGDRTQPNRGEEDYWVVKLDANGNKEWDRAYGGSGKDILRKIVPLPNGQFWLAGHSNSPASFEKSSNAINGSLDFWLVRIDQNGTQLGDYTIGGDELDELYDAILTSDNNLLVAGPSESPTGFNKTAPFYGVNDMWVVKIANNGNVLWDLSLGGNGEDVCQRLRRSADGGYFVIGHSTSDKMSGNKTAEYYGNDDLWLVKFQDNGQSASMSWNLAFGGNASDIGYDLVETSIGNLAVLGESSSAADSIGKDAPLLGGKDFWVILLNPDGSKRWEQTVGGLSDDSGRFIFDGLDYGYILAGISNSNTYEPYKSDDNRGPAFSNDLYVVRIGCSFPAPEFEDLPKICLDDEFSLDATIPAPCVGCNYFWNDGPTGPTRTISPDTTTEYKVTVVHPDGCEMTDSVTINIVPPPDGFSALGEPISCYGANDAMFSVDSVSSIAPPFQFSLNGGEWEPFADYINMEPGIYQLEILDSNGCKLDTSFYIPQPDSVLVELGPDIYLEFGDSVQLQALTNILDSIQIDWGQPNLLSCTDCPEPWVNTFYTTTISVELKDKNGCKGEDLLRVIVQKSDAVYIPNAFSPNNLDNINDFFTVYADKAVVSVKTLQVYDRWGELMFENYDFQPNKPQIGWNGRHNDRMLDPAVFTYWTEVVYVDGRTEVFTGDLVLMN